MNDRQMCAGSLVNEKTIITAAHCLLRPISMYTLRLGSTFRERGGVLRKAKKLIRHKGYTSDGYLNDIGFVVMDEPVQLSNSIQTIKLADTELEDGDNVTVVGWGYHTFGVRESKPNKLNAVDLTFMDFSECQKILKDELKDGMLCATNQDFSKDACTVRRSKQQSWVSYYIMIRIWWAHY